MTEDARDESQKRKEGETNDQKGATREKRSKTGKEGGGGRAS